MEGVWLFLALISAILATVCSLECYTCHNQDNNNDKCVKTTMQCEQGYDGCKSLIKWRIPPYWTPRGERIYDISKGCTIIGADKQCDIDKKKINTRCKRDWYNDWKCLECCAGDLCNYYVTLGSGQLRSSVIITIVTTMVGLFLTTMRV